MDNINENSLYINEWLSIENIATKKYQQKFLKDYRGLQDDCEKYKNDCEYHEGCEKYKRLLSKTKKTQTLCVAKERIKSFKKGVSLYGKNKRIYRILETNLLGLIDGDEVYYLIMLSVSTNNIYILFPTGAVFKNNLRDMPNLVNFLQSLNDYIMTNLLSFNKIIFCGHSMGCVLSIFAATLMNDRDNSLFQEKFMLIGSAPYKCISDNSFSNLLNVYIFVYGDENEEPPNKPILKVDCYIFKGVSEYNYSPLIYFGVNGIIKNTENYTIEEQDFGCSYLHMWENYYNLLSKIFTNEMVASYKIKEAFPDLGKSLADYGKLKRSTVGGRKTRYKKSKRTKKNKRTRRC